MNHCRFYHDKDNINYIFHYRENEIWEKFYYPPEPLPNKNIYNNNQLNNIQKGLKNHDNFYVNSYNQNNYYKGKGPYPTSPNNFYNTNKFKGKDPSATFPETKTWSNNSYYQNKHKGKNTFTTSSSNFNNPNNYKGKDPQTTLPHIVADTDNCEHFDEEIKNKKVNRNQ